MRVENQTVAKIELTGDKRIEYCGRVCYASQHLMNDDTEKGFIRGIINRGHTSVLEHSEITIAFDGKYAEMYSVLKDVIKVEKYFKIMTVDEPIFGGRKVTTLVSANCRAWLEFIRREFTKDGVSNFDYCIHNLITEFQKVSCVFNEFEARKDLGQWVNTFEIITEDNFISNAVRRLWEDEMKIYTFELTTNRAIANELVRHRTCSFSQQSTRYCNYTQEKFGGEITFVNEDEKLMADADARNILESAFAACEKAYNDLIARGFKPDNARAILPNGTKCILMMSATKDNWEKVFKLRCDSHAHFEVQNLCNDIKSYFNE